MSGHSFSDESHEHRPMQREILEGTAAAGWLIDWQAPLQPLDECYPVQELDIAKASKNRQVFFPQRMYYINKFVPAHNCERVKTAPLP
jgi:hypothetical protein